MSDVTVNGVCASEARPDREGHAVGSISRAFAVAWAAALGMMFLGVLAAVQRGGAWDARGGVPESGMRGVAIGGFVVPAMATGTTQGGAGLPPGWYARYGSSRGGKANGRGAAAAAETGGHAARAAFAFKAGESVHPGIASSGFTATYDGTIAITEPGRYRFGAEVEGGTVKLRVFGGKLTGTVEATFGPAGGSRGEMSRWIDLPVGTVNVQYAFTRSGEGAARLRAVWEMERKGLAGFGREPIPPEAVRVPLYGEAGAATGMTAMHGRMLLGELGCLNCHEGGKGAAAAVLAREAPVLDGIGGRVDPAWVLRWITDPQGMKPGCGMPGVIGGSAKDRADAEAIAAFLGSLGGPFEPRAVATEERVIDFGMELYHTVGCVACHGVLEGDGAGFTPVSPLTGLEGKWDPAALSAFLHDPLKTHPDGRMPSLGLTVGEADLLATYLVHVWGRPGVNDAGRSSNTRPAGDVAAGRAAFAARGCADCHRVNEGGQRIVSTAKARPIARVRNGKGCLDPKDSRTPRYALSADDRGAIAAAIEEVKASTGAPAPVDETERLVGALNCRTCHEVDGTGGVDPAINTHFVTLEETDLGDEGRIPPRLTGVGSKLATGWMREVISEGARARPYMAARMPHFGAAHGGALAAGLAAREGVWANADEAAPEMASEMVEGGFRLMGTSGLNCISCHAFGDYPLAGTPGPDITAFGERLRYEWWSRYVHAPEREKPGTRMPSFYATGTGGVTAVFGGDPKKQVDAMWAYFNLGTFTPVPEGVPAPGSLRIRVTDRPRVVRTFLRGAGSRGIAVGFPAGGGVHFSFDAERCRVAEIWKGEFLEASGAWAGRGGTVAGGQGASAWTAPQGPSVVIGARPGSGEAAAARFRGYQLDAEGTPTFTYTIGDGVTVRERCAPAVGKGRAVFVREFRVSGVAGGSDVWVNVGKGAWSVVKAEGGEAERVTGEDGAMWVRVRVGGAGDEGEVGVVVEGRL